MSEWNAPSVSVWVRHFVWNFKGYLEIPHKISCPYIERYFFIQCWNFKEFLDLTHWGRVTHICISNLTIIVSDNGLSPGCRQAIIWTNAGILLIKPLATNFSEIIIKIQTFSLKKIRLKMSSAKCCSFRLGLNVSRAHKCESNPRWRIYAVLMNWFNIVSDDGLSLRQCQAITRDNAGILSVGPLGTHSGEISIQNLISFSRLAQIISGNVLSPVWYQAIT